MSGRGRPPGVKNAVKKDDKQNSLDSMVGKHVAFEDQERLEMKEEYRKLKAERVACEKLRVSLQEELAKIRQERAEMEKIKIDFNTFKVELTERLEKMESKLEEYEIKDFESVEKSTQSMGRSRASSVAGSMWSVNSALSLSEREVWRMKKMVSEQDRKERQNNIAIKGASIERGTDVKSWVTQFVDQNVGVKADVVKAWQNGVVIIAKLGSWEQKSAVMKGKSRLKGTTIYIENDMSYDERKKQELIIKWVKEKKAEGIEVKVGQGRVRINGEWKKWEDIKQDVQRNTSDINGASKSKENVNNNFL